MISESDGQGDQGKGGCVIADGRKYGTSRNKEIADTMNPAIIVNDSFFGIRIHSSRSHVMLTTPIFIPFLEFIFPHSSPLASEGSPVPGVDSPSWYAAVSYCNEPAIFRL